jgi:uncharacterized protein YndB with AHSA1/START domain
VRLDVALDEFFPYPVGSVWAVLTDAEAISDWLMATSDFRPGVGARFRLRTQHLSANGWIDAEVLELDPPRRMVWSWSVNDGSQPTTVTFELEREGEGTRLRLHHEGMIDPAFGSLLVDGWPGRIALLAEILQRPTREVT